MQLYKGFYINPFFQELQEGGYMPGLSIMNGTQTAEKVFHFSTPMETADAAVAEAIRHGKGIIDGYVPGADLNGL